MKKRTVRVLPLATLAIFCAGAPLLFAAPQDPKPIFNPADAEAVGSLKTEGATVSAVPDGTDTALKAEFPGDGKYPTVSIPAPGGTWDLSAFAGVQVELVNQGQAGVNIAMRVDNGGDWKKSPWNTEATWLSAGATKTLKVTFGKSYGNAGYALNASKITFIRVFAVNPKSAATVLIRNVKPFGTASAAAPAAVSAAPAAAAPAAAPAPAGANLFNAADAANLARVSNEGATFAAADQQLKIDFPAGNGYPAVAIAPPAGGWNLSAFQGVQVEFTNNGPVGVNASLRVDNAGDWKKGPFNTESVFVPAGATKTLKVTFGKSYGGNQGYALDASKVTAIKIFAANPKEGATILAGNIKGFGTGTPTAATTTASTATAPATTAAAATGPVVTSLFSATDAAALAKLTSEGATFSAAGEQLKVDFPGGNGYPAVALAGPWNLAAYAGVQVDFTNNGPVGVNAALRVDNAGDWKKGPFNSESVYVPAGATKTLKVTFGRSYGNPGYALDASKVTAVKVFAINPKEGASLLVGNVKPFGTGGGTATATASAPAGATASPVAQTGPVNMTAPPISGELWTLTEKTDISTFKTQESTVTLDAVNGAPALKVVFQAGANYPNVQFPVPKGGWNLSAFGGIQIDVTNPGEKAVTALVRADNPGDWKQSPWNTESLKIPAGATKTLQTTFGTENGAPGFPLDPKRITAIQLFIIKPKQDVTLLLSGLKAYGSPKPMAEGLSKPEDRNIPVTPAAWVGKKPPVDGNWIQTLNENFDGNTINDKLWSDKTWWNGLLAGQTQRYSKDNLVLKDGVLNFKTERRPGPEYDDPKLPSRDYTTGLLLSYDKWTQLYGYFEARIKLPTAKGLWPAFWMMPDRGPAAGPEGWKRESTDKGGMEIDILEHLTEWGDGRNNVAAHWDGYGDNHKQWGTSNVYFGPTPDGWHTFGLLWEPGKLTWYIDGIKKVEFENERVGSIPAYLMLNVQMGGWATKNVEEDKLPDSMQVDWVRAWQLKERVK